MNVCKTVSHLYLRPTEKPHFQEEINSLSSSSAIFTTTELQIRGGREINSKIIFLFLNRNICCDPSIELPHRDSLGEAVLMIGHKICFYGEIWITIPELSQLPLLSRSTAKRKIL